MEFNLIYKNLRLEEIKKTMNLLNEKLFTPIAKISLKYAKTKEPVLFEDKERLPFLPIELGKSWGELFDCAWFECRGQISKEYLNEDLYLRFDVSGEALLYDNSGTPVKGFTNGSSVFDRQYGEPGKRYFKINDFVNEDGTFILFLDCGCNDLFGSYQDNGRIILADIALKDEAIESLYYDLETCIDLLLIYKKDSQAYENLFETLHEIYHLVEYEEPNMISKAKSLVQPFLKKDTLSKTTVHALGHAHLDLAWLWPIRETKRKLLRTLANVFFLFEKYPDFTFGFSQPQLLEWLETESPELFSKVQYYHKQGRLELQGGAWVEMDTNLSGEEAMIRHFLYGINYYRRHFDFTPKSLWLPDVFGYSGNLPQIVKKSGMDYFMTIKISWSLINQFPHHTFNFEGIDGSQILAHMPPEGNYNSSGLAHAFKQTEEQYREKDISEDTLLLFGIGDGGGGPGEEHMERIHRNQLIADLPNIDIISSEQFFDNLAKKKNIFPTYHGELYLENHQGTFTSQSNIKKWNRKLEQKLKSVEYLLSYLNESSENEELDRIWKEVLLYQFHDILPGSSIQRVYEETLERYEVLDEELNKMLDRITDSRYCREITKANYIFNPLPYETSVYLSEEDFCRKITVEGLSSNKVSDKEFEINEIAYSEDLVTEVMSLKISSSGEIISLFDKRQDKEMILSRNSNALRVYKDTGDAWNINYGYRAQTPKRLTLESAKLYVSDDFYEYRMLFTFKNSSVNQTMRVFKKDAYILFEHDVNWQDIGYMLRSQFDLDIEAETAQSDIQFGYISRSRLSKTDVEKAMLEVPSQQWISIDDGVHGAALLNTSKYGYYIKDNLLDINLLRSTNHPCESGDIGQTSYSYALLLHDADLNYVDRMSQQLNACYLGFDNNLVKKQLFEWDNQAIHLSTLKPAYNRDGDILRLYNNSSQNQSVLFNFVRNEYNVSETNMIEDDDKNLGDLSNLHLTFSPFEVKTFRLINKHVKGYFPYSIPRAKTIYAYQNPMIHEEIILLSSIQGVLAKKEAKLYISSTEAYDDWMEQILEPKHKVIFLKTVDDVINTFENDIVGYVIYNKQTTSQNIAATIAGVEGYILVEENQLELFEGKKCDKIDARTMDYAYMLEHYKEDLNFDLILQQAPIYCGLYDIGIALRGVYSSNIKTELIDNGIQLEKDTPILGWVPDDEVIGVTYLSEIDCNMIASNHSLNMTMFIRNADTQVFLNRVGETPADDQKHYITFVLSDGDNVQWMMGDYYQNVRTYGHPKRGKVPFGWSISPSIIDLAPEILELYYKNKTDNDLFTSGVSGAGYMYPDQYSEEALEKFLDRTEYYFRKLNIDYLAILGTREFDIDKSSLKAYAKREQIKGGFLYANFDRYKGYNGEVWWENDKPFISARFALWDYENLQELTDEINQGIVSPTSIEGYSMIVVHTWSHTYQDVLDIIDKLDNHIQVLNPRTFMKQLQKKCKR